MNLVRRKTSIWELMLIVLLLACILAPPVQSAGLQQYFLGLRTGSVGLTIGGGDLAVNSAAGTQAFKVTRNTGAILGIGTYDPTITCAAAGGDRGINLNISQISTTALTGTLAGIYARATAGSVGGTGTIRGCEVGARVYESAAANAASVVTGGYFWADAKTETATTLRGLEVSLDGGAGGTSTLASGIVIFNNSSATQTSSYAVDVNEGSLSGRKAFTADIRGQNGETLSNATNGVWATSGDLAVSGGAIAAGAATGTAGSLSIYPSTGTRGRLRITTSAMTGDTVTDLSCAAQAAARTYTIPDAGANANVVLNPSAGNAVFTRRVRVPVGDAETSDTLNHASGAILLPAIAGVKYQLVDYKMIAIGGAATTADGVAIMGTQSASGVAVTTVLVAALTENAIVTMCSGTPAAAGAGLAPMDENTAIVAFKTGLGSLGGCTHIDIILTYTTIKA